MDSEDPWCDPGEASNVIHHMPSAPGPLTHAPTRYREYVSLQEWESRTDALAAEAIPVKRNQLSDYIAPVAVPQHFGSEELASSEPLDSVLDDEVIQCVKQPPRTPRRTEPKVDAIGVWLKAREKAGLSPRQNGSSRTSAHSPSSPRRRGTSTQAAAKMICASPLTSRPGLSGRAKSPVALTSPQPHVRTVDPTLFAPKRGASGHRKPRIKSKDDGKYPSGDMMRPAIMTNFENRRRLVDVLGYAHKIDAKQLHPSKACNLVPMTNLRVT